MEENPITAEEIKTALRPARVMVARLKEGWQADEAAKHLDAARDHALRSLEGAPAPVEAGKG
jgi:hypothetical protein